MSDDEQSLDQRRRAAESKTVQEAIDVNWRLQAICLRCDRAPVIDLRPLAAKGWGHHTLRALRERLTCRPCQQARRKYSIHPPGKDIFIRVLFVGDSTDYVKGPSPF